MSDVTALEAENKKLKQAIEFLREGSGCFCRYPQGGHHPSCILARVLLGEVHVSGSEGDTET